MLPHIHPRSSAFPINTPQIPTHVPFLIPISILLSHHLFTRNQPMKINIYDIACQGIGICEPSCGPLKKGAGEERKKGAFLAHYYKPISLTIKTD